LVGETWILYETTTDEVLAAYYWGLLHGSLDVMLDAAIDHETYTDGVLAAALDAYNVAVETMNSE